MRPSRLGLCAIALAVVWLLAAPGAGAQECRDVCVSGSSCSLDCYVDSAQGPQWITCQTWGRCGEMPCGDGTCAADEDCGSCPADCHCTIGKVCTANQCVAPPPDDDHTPGASCPDGFCDAGESCPADCGTPASNLAPVANAGGPYTAARKRLVLLQATGSYDPDGGSDIQEFSWSFGDGGSGTGLYVGHIYETSGTHHVGLIVKDSVGHQSRAFTTVAVGDVSAQGEGGQIIYFEYSKAFDKIVFVASNDSTYDPNCEPFIRCQLSGPNQTLFYDGTQEATPNICQGSLKSPEPGSWTLQTSGGGWNPVTQHIYYETPGDIQSINIEEPPPPKIQGLVHNLWWFNGRSGNDNYPTSFEVYARVRSEHRCHWELHGNAEISEEDVEDCSIRVSALAPSNDPDDASVVLTVDGYKGSSDPYTFSIRTPAYLLNRDDFEYSAVPGGYKATLDYEGYDQLGGLLSYPLDYDESQNDPACPPPYAWQPFHGSPPGHWRTEMTFACTDPSAPGCSGPKTPVSPGQPGSATLVCTTRRQWSAGLAGADMCMGTETLNISRGRTDLIGYVPCR